MMTQCRWRPATWVLACLIATPLGSPRLAAQAGADAGAGQPLPPFNAQNAPPAPPAQEQPEVLTRGPVHEAFAQPVDLQVQADVIAPKPPPAMIEEVPPAERPLGQQAAWIPGYWSWDADRNGYIWISACWRVAPPGRSWMPGYWARVSTGWEWVAGFWAPAGVRAIDYLPTPPPVGALEPPGPAPSPNTIWVPPCMYWAQGQYVRRAGYWLAAQPNWIWVPSHYVVTPRGCIFAEGHWDYALENRGVLFAPIYFPAAVYGRPAFTYSPSIVIDLGLLEVSLFAYPRYSHYYFGDYYDDAYLRLGIYPWFDSRRLHTWYDPIYEHGRWQHQRSEPRWENRQRDDYNHRRADRDLRPARTYREQESRLARLPEPQRRAFRVAQPITIAATRREAPLKFEQINTATRQAISKQATTVRTFRDERNRWESPTVSPKTVAQPAGDRKPAVTPPLRRTEPPASQERRGTVTAPAAPREPAFVPARRTTLSQPERVHIPAPPIVGRSAGPGSVQKSPPARPANEDRDRAGKETRKNRATVTDRDMRENGK